jgi:hypothetical protein
MQVTFNTKFKDTKIKYSPYAQSVRDDIAKFYWKLRRDGLKEIAAIQFRRQKQAYKMLEELILNDFNI